MGFIRGAGIFRFCAFLGVFTSLFSCGGEARELGIAVLGVGGSEKGGIHGIKRV